MLTVELDKNRQKLKAKFDFPIPSSFENENELYFLISKLKEVANADFYREGNELKGFSVELSHWIRFIEEILSPKAFFLQKNILDELLKQKASVQGDGLEINFHQNTFDTPVRFWNFILNQGHLVDYFFNRINWHLVPKYQLVSPFPLHVDLESASTCNMNCPMCYRDMLNEVGQMDMDLFKKAIDECAIHNIYSVRLSWRGETLTHPRIKEMIAYATRKITNVSFLTNAFYLDEGIVDCLIENRLSYVAVSFDGIGKIYESIRQPASFKENYQRLAVLREKRKKANSKLPQVRVCTIWPAISENPDAYYQTMKDVSDYIVCNPYINFKGAMKIKPNFVCQYPWERIVVGYNGKVQSCTGWNADDIILGNVRDQSIQDMWNSNRINEIREIHSQGRRMELEPCANCRHGSETDPDISIREIIERCF